MLDLKQKKIHDRPDRPNEIVEPPRTDVPGRITGQVSGLQQREEPYGQYKRAVWTFKVERFDTAGNRLRPIPIEMRGLWIEGLLSDGDWVQVFSSWQPGQTISAKRVFNLTTQSDVQVKSQGGFAFGVLLILVILVFLGGFLVFGLSDLFS